MKKLLSTATVSVLALALAACSSSSPTTSSTASTDASSTASAATGNSGNRVTLAKENDVISMDSTYATDGMSFEMIAATVEGL